MNVMSEIIGINELNIQDTDNLIRNYLKSGGKLYPIKEGVLGYGLMILYGGAEVEYHHVISELYVSRNDIRHKVESYKNGLPRRYYNMIKRMV